MSLENHPDQPDPTSASSVFDFPDIQEPPRELPLKVSRPSGTRRKLLPLDSSKKALRPLNSSSSHPNTAAFLHDVNATLSQRGKTMKKEGTTGISLIPKSDFSESKHQPLVPRAQPKDTLATSTYSDSVFSAAATSKSRGTSEQSSSGRANSQMLIDSLRDGFNDLFSSNVFAFP